MILMPSTQVLTNMIGKQTPINLKLRNLSKAIRHSITLIINFPILREANNSSHSSLLPFNPNQRFLLLLISLSSRSEANLNNQLSRKFNSLSQLKAHSMPSGLQIPLKQLMEDKKVLIPSKIFSNKVAKIFLRTLAVLLINQLPSTQAILLTTLVNLLRSKLHSNRKLLSSSKSLNSLQLSKPLL